MKIKADKQKSTSVQDLIKDLKKKASPEKARFLQKYFKTGKGEYGHGDIFLGVTVPDQRTIAHKYLDFSLQEVKQLLSSNIHEYRFTALELLVAQYKKSKDSKTQRKIYEFYLKNTKYINNWDLVDTSAGYIVGHYCFHHGRSVLYKLARSKNIWERRIAIIATSHFIKQNSFKDTLALAKILLNDTHDLIHKAVGWMLREVGNKSQETEEVFLKKHSKEMPRTMLRYALEKFPPHKRVFYMKQRQNHAA